MILTDGQPTIGEQNPEVIVQNAIDALLGTEISLNCLGFGLNLNYDLLLKLALSNRGIARQIYEADDAASQLEGFFEAISQPILRDVTIIYEEGAVEDISTTEFPVLYNGSEIVVVGQFSCNTTLQTQSITVQVLGTGTTGPNTFESEVSSLDTAGTSGFQVDTERLVAYLLIEQLLESRVIAESQEVDVIEGRVLELALKYNFVTELTSLIVIEESDGPGRENFTLGEGDSMGGAREDEDAVFNGGIPVSPGCSTCNPAPAQEGSHSGRTTSLSIFCLLFPLAFVMFHVC